MPSPEARPLRYAIVGCGLVGRKRAASLAPGQLAIACDVQATRAAELIGDGVACATADPMEAVNSADVDAVIVSTVNSSLAPVALAAIDAGKHVLIEKPAGISVAEIDGLDKAAKARRVKVRVGFNHRYHPAFRLAREIFEAGRLGELMFVRARYGHGGRAGYDREWRADFALSGGGELIDQGVHLIDLARWFLGEFVTIEGHVATCFWDMPVEDNAFLNLRTATGQTAFLHASCTEWKNLFSFEIYGRHAKLQIEGLGGSYGPERLHVYQMKPEMGPPEATVHEFAASDQSWSVELAEFEKDIRLDREPQPGLAEARATLEIVQKIYRASGYPRQ